MTRRILGAVAIVAAFGVPARAQAVRTLDDLARLSPGQLDALFGQAGPGAIPSGKVRGMPLVRPGTRGAVAMSRSGRVLWQGKVLHPEEGCAVNRFFGVRSVPGRLGYGNAWYDGRPAIVLDYADTSRVYAPYRDEIREVAPGLYLGLMYDRNDVGSGPVRYFAFERR